MVKYTREIVIGMGFVALVLGGCTHEAQTDYNSAGEKIVQAAKDTGHALKVDAAHAADATKAALDKNDKSVAIKKGLMDHPDLHLTNLNVDVKDNKVTLTGNVPTEVLNQRAEQATRHLAGSGYKVEDNLKVSGN